MTKIGNYHKINLVFDRKGQKTMIKNIVFDMGNVVVKFNPWWAGEQFIPNIKIRKEVITNIFMSYEWLMLDIGLISEKEGLERMLSRLDTQEKNDAALLCFHNWHLVCMKPFEEIVHLIYQLKKAGKNIFMLSNASMRLPHTYQKAIPSWELFDGFLFSAEIGYIKPQKEIYQEAFQRFSISPEESFFIDDLINNIEGAKRCKMDGYCFDGQIPPLIKKLQEVTGVSFS